MPSTTEKETSSGKIFILFEEKGEEGRLCLGVGVMLGL